MRESSAAVTAADRLDEPFMVPDNQRLWGDECHDASKGGVALDSFHRGVSVCEVVPLHDFGPTVVQPVMVALQCQEAGLRRGPPANDRSVRVNLGSWMSGWGRYCEFDRKGSSRQSGETARSQSGVSRTSYSCRSGQGRSMRRTTAASSERK